MDFSEYTLISFGDSFTFGQDIIPRAGDIHHTGEENSKKWKLDCNEKSYTQVLCDKMGFKDNLNFGVPGGSNERSLNLLDSFLRQNPTLKIFVLFNFTASARHLNLLKIDNASTYDIVEMTSNDSDDRMAHSKYTGINRKSVGEHYTYFRNNIQEMYLHIRDRRMLYNMLSAYSVPHVTFDVLNDIDARMIIDNPIEHINDNDGVGIMDLYRSDESYVFTKMDYFNSYYRELMEDTSLLSHIGIDYLNGERNATLYLRKLGDERYENYPDGYYTSEFGCHWSPEGHIEVAKLIEKYINENHN